MTFFINGIKLTTIYARRVRFFLLSCRDLFISFFAFYLNLGSKMNVRLRLEISIHHPGRQAASGDRSVWEGGREGGRQGGLLLAALSWWWLQYCAPGCH